jgi:hypothetical protein
MSSVIDIIRATDAAARNARAAARAYTANVSPETACAAGAASTEAEDAAEHATKIAQLLRLQGDEDSAARLDAAAEKAAQAYDTAFEAAADAVSIYVDGHVVATEEARDAASNAEAYAAAALSTGSPDAAEAALNAAALRAAVEAAQDITYNFQEKLCNAHTVEDFRSVLIQYGVDPDRYIGPSLDRPLSM